MKLSENMIPDEISVISVQDINCEEETEEIENRSRKVNLQNLRKALFISIEFIS